MNGLIGVLAVLFELALAVAVFICGTWVVVGSLNDIAANGASFWNVFWILLTASLLVGSSSRIAH